MVKEWLISREIWTLLLCNSIVALDRMGDRGWYFFNGSPVRCDSHSDLGVMVDVGLHFHCHGRPVLRQASWLSRNLFLSTMNRNPQFVMSPFVSYI